MIQLIYTSTATAKMSTDDLNRLLEIARTANLEHHITGMLLYKNRLFIQVIEGDNAAIEQLYRNIENDNTHRNVLLLLKQEIQTKEFPDWTMGFKEISKDQEGYSNFLELTESEANREITSTIAKRLLTSFRDISKK